MKPSFLSSVLAVLCLLLSVPVAAEALTIVRSSQFDCAIPDWDGVAARFNHGRACGSFITVDGLPADAVIAGITVSVTIIHPFRGDLLVWFGHASQSATLSDRSGGNGDNIIGSFSLSAFNGQSPTRTWALWAQDLATADTGFIDSWAITVEYTIPASNLPPPILVTPGHGDTGHPLTTAFGWDGVSGATSYRLMVATTQSALPRNTDADTCACVINATPSGTSFTAAAGALVAGTTYWWQVKARNSSQLGEWSVQRSFTTGLTTLAAPTLITPGDGASGQPTTLTFSWASITGATSYRVMVATSQGALPRNTDADTCACVINATPSGTSYTAPAGTLVAGTTYWWQVKARNISQLGEWSVQWSFTTSLSTLAAPVLITPGDGASGQPSTLTFSWTSITGATSYRVMVATSQAALPRNTDADTCACVINATPSGTSFTAAAGTLAAGTTYWWQVKARNNSQLGEWSIQRSFTTGTATLAAPTLIAPGNGTGGHSTTPTLTWGSVTGATSYRVMVATSQAALPRNTDADACACVINTTPTATSFTPAIGRLAAGVTYWWQVKARNSSQLGTWSAQRSFTTATLTIVASATFSPPSGTTFTATQAVTMSTTTSGAHIRYTTNGSSPTDSSSLYGGPITLAATTTVKARAFKTGASPSAITTATYTKASITALRNSRAVTNIDLATLQEKHYRITVGSSQERLVVTLSGGTGDCDLYVRLGAPASRFIWDYRRSGATNFESVTISGPASGDWYIMIRGGGQCSGTSLLAQYGNGGGNSLLRAATDAVGLNLFDRYHRDRFKYLGFASASLQVQVIYNIDATAYLDLADYMGITGEGFRDWVTVWIRGSVGLGFDLCPVSFGVQRRDFNLVDRLPDREFSAGLTFGELQALTLNLTLLNFSLEDPVFEFARGDLEALCPSASFLTIASPSTSFEIQRRAIDAILLNAITSGVTASLVGPQLMTYLIHPARSTVTSFGRLRPALRTDQFRRPGNDKTDDGI